MNNSRLKDGRGGFRRCSWSVRDVVIVFTYAVVLFFVFCFWLTVLYAILGFILQGSFYSWRRSLLLFFKGDEEFFTVLLFYAALYIVMKVKIFKKYKLNEFEFFAGSGRIKEDAIYGFFMYLKFILIVFSGIVLAFFIATIWDMMFGSGILEKVNVFFVASEIERIGIEKRVEGTISVIVLLIFAPFFEELFFRGCLYRALRARFSRLSAIVSSSLIFSLLHGYFFLFIFVFLVGMMLAYIYEKRESLVAPLAFHMVNNLVVIVLILMQL